MEDNKNTSVEQNLDNQEQENKETKTYTQDEVLALIQSEADKRVTSALKKQKQKYEKELSLSKLDGSDARDEQVPKDVTVGVKIFL